MNIIYSPPLVLLIMLLPGLLAAEDKAANKSAVAAEEASAALANLAGKKRAAALKLTVTMGPDSKAYVYGVFISDTGLALVGLVGLARKTTPAVAAADGASLKFGTILETFPDQGIALMKFNYSPKVWLNITAKELEVGETVALIPLNGDAPMLGKVPPVVGPVMAKRTAVTTVYRVAQYVRILSLGSGLSVEQGAFISPGCFAVDGKGDLVAFFMGTKASSRQTLIELCPINSLADRVGVLAKNGNDLGHPLPDSRNPIDAVVFDPDWAELGIAFRGRDRVSAERLIKGLLLRHPTSQVLRFHAATNSMFVDPDNPLLELEAIPEPKPNPGSPDNAQQSIQWSARAALLHMQGDTGGALRAIEAATALSPKDVPTQRAVLAEIYLHSSRLDDAENLFKQALKAAPENITINEQLESLLTKQHKWADLKPIEKRIEELDRIYRRQ